MNILFTGASSFSGMWFATELAKAGHNVTAIFQQPKEVYKGLKLQRVTKLLPFCTPFFQTIFGEAGFLEAIDSQKKWDLFCHHAAEVTDYKSPLFNAAAALTKNTNNLQKVLAALQAKGCNKILLTGSVFEQKEGTGSDGLQAVSPYGLSKGLTSDTFAFYASMMKMKLGKFVISNPFGPYEEERFTSYLAQTWLRGKSAIVNAPLYIRDNVPISLLAKVYTCFATQLSDTSGFEKYNPSCYVESQGEFTHRFAHEMKSRLAIPCHFELKEQQDFSEPLARINTDVLNWSALGYSENQAWDDIAHFYKETYAN